MPRTARGTVSTDGHIVCSVVAEVPGVELEPGDAVRRAELVQLSRSQPTASGWVRSSTVL